MMQQFSLPVVHLFDKCQEHRPVGSVLFLDLVETPTPVVKSKNWLIKSRIEPMRQLEYPFAKNGDEVIEDDQDAVSLAMQWPASVQFELPPGLLVQAEAATVMWWDASVERWSSAGIEEVDLSLSSNQVKFRTTHFAPTALVQVYCNVAASL